MALAVGASVGAELAVVGNLVKFELVEINSFAAHPWHDIEQPIHFPNELTAFIEIVPTDTVKYEIDKKSGWLKVDRPQLYSNVVPALYGFIPKTFCDVLVGKYCMHKTGKSNIVGDQDPLDILVLSEKNIHGGGILVNAIPVGGMQMVDGGMADDKIIAVMKGDAMFSGVTDISDLQTAILDRIKHYFLTYKNLPGEQTRKEVEIAGIYGKDEAMETIKYSAEDYTNKFA